MRVIVGFRAIALGLALLVTGCAAPPAAEVDAAKAAVDKAVTDGAGQYAAESLKAAQDAQAALDAELTAQESKWFKSYDRAKELAIAAKAAGDKAAAEAVAARNRPTRWRPRRRPTRLLGRRPRRPRFASAARSNRRSR